MAETDGIEAAIASESTTTATVAGEHGARQALLLQALFSASAALLERDGVAIYAFDSLYLVEMAEAKTQICLAAIDEGTQLSGVDFLYARAQANGAIAMLRAVEQAHTVEVRQIIALLELIRDMTDEMNEAGLQVR
jgi:hypothetical protein